MPRPLHLTLRRPVIARIVCLTLCVMGLAMSFGDTAFNTNAAATSDDEARVPLRPNASTIKLSLTLAVTRCGSSTHFYEFELRRSETSSGTFEPYLDDTDKASPLDFSDTHTGYHYRARGKRCASAGTSCGAWSTLSAQLNVPAKTYAAPTLSTPTVSGDADDMTVAFARSTVSALSSHDYVVELHRADTASGTFALNATVTAESTPATFEDIDRSKVYKARAKRCETDDGKVCGPWTSFTSTWDAPSPPSGVTVSLSNLNTMSATYTRSTTPSASTHYYQLRLIRSETSGGTYSDYGDIVNTTSTVSFGTVHTGYHYKAVGRRCRTASTDCGEWSAQSASSNVPVADYTPPPLQMPTLANFDEVSVQFDRATGSRAPPTQYHVVQLTKSDSSTGTHVGYTSDALAAPPSVKFSDVATSAYYKAKAKTCTDMDRKLCGAWSSPTDQLTVPTPGYPPLTAPTLAPGSTGTIVATFSLPSTSFGYLLKLQWSNDNLNFADEPNPGILTHGSSSHTFTGLKPERGGFFRARLSACTDNARRNCGSPAVSVNLVLPVLSIPGTQALVIAGTESLAVNVSASNFNRASGYKIVASSSNTGAKADVLRFEKCDTTTSRSATSEESIGTGSSHVNGRVAFTIYGCEDGVDDLTFKLMRGSAEHASLSLTLRTVGIPNNIRANGHSSSSSSQITVRWDAVPSATSYKVRYRLTYDAGNKKPITDAHWAVVTHTGSTLERVLTTGLRAGRIYGVEVSSLRGGLQTPGALAFVMTTSDQKSLPFSFGPVDVGTYRSEGEYSYEVCSETFPSSAWERDIDGAMAVWPRYVKWLTNGANIITATGSSSDCQSIGCYDPIRNSPCSSIEQPSARNRVIQAYSGAHFERVCDPEMKNPSAVACFVSDFTSSGRVTATLMMFATDDRKSNWQAGQYLNQDDRCSHLFDVALHEGGHAFGLSDIDTGDSVMGPGILGNCHPKPLDIGALMTNYQSID